MAHKKAGGSTRNGRDSESKRWALKPSVVKKYRQAALLFVSAAPSFMQVQTFVWLKTTHYLQPQQVKLSSTRAGRKIVSKFAL
jgi:hypothetical protein